MQLIGKDPVFDWEHTLHLTTQTFWLGPLGFELVRPRVWLSRFHWVWGYWR